MAGAILVEVSFRNLAEIPSGPEDLGWTIKRRN